MAIRGARLLPALLGARADIIAPVRQTGGARADVAVLPGPAHLVLMSFPRLLRRRTSRALARFDPAAAWHGPRGHRGAASPRSALRLIVVPGRSTPRPRDGVVRVGARWLTASLRDAHDPDDVWLTLAAADAAPDGWLGPLPGQPFVPTPAPALPRAPLAVSWDLARTRLPRPGRWQSVRRDAAGRLHLVAVSGPTVLVAGDGGAVVIDLHDVPDLDRPLAVALAEAFQADLAAARASLRTVADYRLRRRTRLLLLAPGWEPDRAAGAVPAVAFRTAAAGGRAAVQIRGDLPGAAAADLAGLRRALAGATAATARPSRAAARRFVHGWCSAPAEIEVHAGVTATALRGHDEILDTAVHSAVEARLLSAAAAGTGPGERSGADARALVNERLVPAVIGMAEALMAPARAADRVHTSLGWLQASLGTHMRQRQAHAYALNSPWASQRRAQHLRRPEDARLAARAAELAAEIALRMDDRPGARPADRVDARLWATATGAALLLAMDSQADYAGLLALSVDVAAGGRVTTCRAPGRVDGAAYTTLRRVHADDRAAAAVGTDPPDVDAPGEQAFAPLPADASGDLAAFDDALRQATGARMNAVVAVLATAAGLDAERGFVAVDRAALAADAAEWAGLDPDEAAAAVDLLTTTGADLRSGDMEFWRLEARPRRLATRPFVGTGGQLVVVTARARESQLLIGGYLADARLPWSKPTTPGPAWDAAREALAQIRQRGAARYERAVADGLRDEGLLVRANVRPVRKGLAWLPGEVDVLAADPSRRRLWVLEVKNTDEPFSPVEMSDEIGDVHGQRWSGGGRRNRRDEARLLRRKADACQARADDVLAHLGVDVPADGWTFHPMIVTPHVSAASLFDDPVVLFCVDDQLADVVRLDALPPAGLVMLLPAAG